MLAWEVTVKVLASLERMTGKERSRSRVRWLTVRARSRSR
jgi:hypothetical protein